MEKSIKARSKRVNKLRETGANLPVFEFISKYRCFNEGLLL